MNTLKGASNAPMLHKQLCKSSGVSGITCPESIPQRSETKQAVGKTGMGEFGSCDFFQTRKNMKMKKST